MRFTIIGMDEYGNEVSRAAYNEPADAPLNHAVGDMLNVEGVSYVELHPGTEDADAPKGRARFQGEG